MKYLIRIIVSPAVLVILVLASAITIILRVFSFIKYGGEWISYDQNANNTTIRDVFNKIQDQQEEEK